MKPITATVLVLVLLGAYIFAVAHDDWVVRNQPKVARFFAPPAFQFSQSFFDGKAAPFRISMPEAEIRSSAASARLVRENCLSSSRLLGLDFPPAVCYSYPLTGTFWNIWTKDGLVVGVIIYTSMNLVI